MTDATKTRRHRRMARETQNNTTTLSAPESLSQLTASETPKTAAKPQTKTTMVLDLLCRPEGATLEKLVTVTGWLPHSSRAALTGLRKKGYALASEKVDDGPRIYRVRMEGRTAADGAGA